MRARVAGLLILALVVPTLSGCFGSSSAPADIVATFYPLEFLASRIASGHLSVASMVPPGVEPHEWEPTPADVARASKAKVFVVLTTEIHHSPDAWAEEVLLAVSDHKGVVIQTASSSDFSLTWTPDEEEEPGHDDHADETGATQPDPHIWLDPQRMIKMSQKVEAGLSAFDPGNATHYKANAEKQRRDLATLDAAYSKRLANCAKHDIVTAHAAFGYLADRYGFKQHGISGLSPEVEPSPQKIRELVDIVNSLQVHYVFFEELVSSRVAKVIAEETGAQTAPLNPVEGLTVEQKQAGFADYTSIMYDNLEGLARGLECR